MTRLVLLTVAASCLWSGMNQLSNPAPQVFVPPHQLTRPNELLSLVQSYHELLALLIALAIGGLLFFWVSIFVETGRRYQLIVTGGMTQGKILSKKVSLGWDASLLQITYRFMTPTGLWVEGKTECSLAEWQQPLGDTAVTVVFDPRHPANSMLYAYGGVKAI
jgi:hypothetical protein